MYRKIDRCRVCGNTELVQVLDLGVQALTGVFPRRRSEPITRGPLRLVKCTGPSEACGLLQLAHTFEVSELYGRNYGYRSGLNPMMVTHLHAKVRDILKRVTLPKAALIVDIGSNDGTTLTAYPQHLCTCIGVDPTGTKFSEFYPKHTQLIPEFFSAETLRRHVGDRKATVVTSFAMFYDLDDPMRFMKDVCDVLDENGIWVFEQSYMPKMLSQNAYDTVCHEHLEYYGLKQIKWMADRVGLKLIDVEFNDVNGGSVSVVAGKAASSHAVSDSVKNALAAEEHERLDSLKPFEAFAERVANSRTALRTFLREARSQGRTVEALGASTKGNVLLQYCDITQHDVMKVGEVNVDKIGAFTPGTMIPIASEDEVVAEKPDYLMLLPWHFRTFFLSNPRFSGMTFLFPLPTLEVIRCG